MVARYPGALLLAASTVAIARPDAAPKAELPPTIAAQYVKPHQLVDVGGRKLNLFCMGEGETTVLFDAGGGDWSVIWALVQPAIAKKARACTYDRAGLGYSESAPGPRTPFAIVDDLHKLIRATDLHRPLIFVGHSLGGFNVKLYAGLYPKDVAALVLVDPSEERDSERSRGFISAKWGADVSAQSELAGQWFLASLIGRYRACADAANKEPLDPTSISYRRCTDPVRPALGPIIAAERVVVQRTAQYQRAQASEIANSVYGDHQADQAYANLFRPGMFGLMPLVVLTAPQDGGADPVDVADAAAGNLLHDQTAALSAAGRREIVAGTGHNIEIDRPDAIIDAVNEVLAQVTAGTRSKH